jgi:hypothetical protein
LISATIDKTIAETPLSDRARVQARARIIRQKLGLPESDEPETQTFIRIPKVDRPERAVVPGMKYFKIPLNTKDE